MTPRANAKLCGMKYVHIAPDNNPSPYLTPKTWLPIACKRSIAGLKSTPSVNNTIGLFAFASGTTSCAAVAEARYPRGHHSASVTAMTGGNFATFQNKALR